MWLLAFNPDVHADSLSSDWKACGLLVHTLKAKHFNASILEQCERPDITCWRGVSEVGVNLQTSLLQSTTSGLEDNSGAVAIPAGLGETLEESLTFFFGGFSSILISSELSLLWGSSEM